MTTPFMRHLLALVVLVGLGLGSAAQASQSQQPFFWWRSEEFKKELRLTPDQITKIDKIFETTRPELRQEMDEFNRYDTKLQRLIETSTDEAQLARQIDRVETARANLNKTRSLMIARMRLVLNADQRAQLKVLYERREQQQMAPQPGQPRPPERRDPRPDSTTKPQNGGDTNKRPGF